ncbi:hypothetical protein IW261DRAFT_307363 [Armillaria novae-zelandiae]|uniref:Uncharacterized protein n=1 Tax=Armillaria novae-zelandiae TaxID=153914 RepID=A0AA39P4S3_9AGAR|nr:hypothetical protein IW261DRAFT_307363 [Armillaria novae-zelandiae]
MISSLAVLSVLTTAVFAQSSSSSAASASSTSSPLIPSGISTSCKSFLESLDSNSNLAACTKALATATDAYAPGNSSSSTTSAITSVLNSITSNSCDETIMSTIIANFGSACQTELVTSPVQSVVLLYDTVYMMNPWLDVLVTKDDSGTYCVLESYNAATNSTQSSASASGYSNAAAAGSTDFDELNKYLVVDQQGTTLSRRAQTVVATPNATTWTTNGIPFLFFTSSLSSTTLCTTCSRNVMTTWISWESKVPYAPAAKESALLSGLNDLYSAIQSKCGKSFLSGAVTAAGGLGTSDAARMAASRKSLVSFVAGLAALAVAVCFSLRDEEEEKEERMLLVLIGLSPFCFSFPLMGTIISHHCSNSAIIPIPSCRSVNYQSISTFGVSQVLDYIFLTVSVIYFSTSIPWSIYHQFIYVASST